MKVYDRQAVIDRYGIPPTLVPDFIGLKGDTSDNIPGVPGIGDKTAADLLQKFGDLEGVLEQRRPDHRRQAQAEPDRPRRQRAHEQAAGDDGHETSRSTIDLEEEFTKTPDRTEPAPGLPRLGAARPAPRGSRRPSPRPTLEAIPRPTDLEKVEVKTGLARTPRRRHAPEGRVPRARGPAARGPRGRADPARAQVALRGLRGREHRALGRGRQPGRGRRRRRRPRGASRTTPRRSPRSRTTSCSTPRSPPTCSTPPGAATRWRSSSARSAGISAEAGDALATRAVLTHELGQAAAPADRRARPPGPAGHGRAAARAGAAARPRRSASSWTRSSSRRSPPGSGADVASLETRDLGARRARSSCSARPSSSAQVLFEKLGLSTQEARQDRLQHRTTRCSPRSRTSIPSSR